MTEGMRPEDFYKPGDPREDVKQTNFRLNQDDAEKFRKFCSENGMNHAQGFSHIIQAIELNRAKEALPGQVDNIENFEMHIKALLTGYMNLLDMNANAEERAKEQFTQQLESKDKSIMDYQEKLTKEKDAVKDLESQLGELDSLKKELALLKTELDTAKDQLSTKDSLLLMKDEKLAAAEEKAKAYDGLLTDKQAVDAELADARSQLKEKNMELNQKLALAAANCEKEKTQAVQAAKEAAQKEKDELRDKLLGEKEELQKQLLDEEKAAREREQELAKEIRTLEQQVGQLREDKKQLEVDKKQLELEKSTLEKEFETYKKAHPEKQSKE